MINSRGRKFFRPTLLHIAVDSLISTRNVQRTIEFINYLFQEGAILKVSGGGLDLVGEALYQQDRKSSSDHALANLFGQLAQELDKNPRNKLERKGFWDCFNPR